MTVVSVPVLEYFEDPAVQEKVQEVGRIIYSNSQITVNLGAIIAAGALAVLGETISSLTSRTILTFTYHYSGGCSPLLLIRWPGLLHLRGRLRRCLRRHVWIRRLRSQQICKSDSKIIALYHLSVQMEDIGDFVTNLLGSSNTNPSYPVSEALGSRGAWNTGNLAASNLINWYKYNNQGADINAWIIHWDNTDENRMKDTRRLKVQTTEENYQRELDKFREIQTSRQTLKSLNYKNRRKKEHSH